MIRKVTNRETGTNSRSTIAAGVAVASSVNGKLDVFSTEGLERAEGARLMPRPQQLPRQYGKRVTLFRVADVGAAGHDAGDVADGGDAPAGSSSAGSTGSSGTAGSGDRGGKADGKGGGKGSLGVTGATVGVEVGTSGCTVRGEMSFGYGGDNSSGKGDNNGIDGNGNDR